MEIIKEFIRSKGYEFDVELDGGYHEFKTEGGKGWYIGEAVDGKVAFTFGDWRSGDRWHFQDGFTEEDVKNSKEQQEQFKKAKLKRQEATRDEAKKEWDSLESIGMSPYLSSKKIGNLLGCKTQANSWGGTNLVIPMYDEHGVIWNLQKIQEDKFKAFLPGGRNEGLFFVIGEIKDVIYITEGFATGASVHLATEQGVVVSFMSSNLERVAEIFRRKYPKHPIVIAGDDDHSKNPNAGKESATQAAAYVSGTACFPQFGKSRADADTDWNDLHRARGLNEVKAQFDRHKNSPPAEGFTLPPQDEAKSQSKKEKKDKQQAKAKARQRIAVQEHLKPWINGISPLPERWVDGKLVTPSEFEVASELMKDYYTNKILKQDEDIFAYTGTHWRLLGIPEIHKIKMQLQVLYGGTAKTSLLDSTYKHFTLLIPKAPLDLFIPNPTRANFLNGTLHVLGKKLEFLPHSPKDFCTNVIPIEYDTTRKVRNEEFEGMLNRIVGEGEERSEKIRAIKQMYGACLCPISPKLFLLWGQGGRGKSSVIIPAQRLVHKDNWSAVEPKDFKGFNMESMVGKLVNFVSDIDTTEPIDDANIKKIWDRMPIRIDRKFKPVINAPLPALHIFAGNDIPSTYEKSSGAHARRWVFIELNNYHIGESYILNFANQAFEASPQGVLNFALEGLEDLIQNDFKFHSPESSKEKVREWELQYDKIGLFLEDLRQGEVEDLAWGENLKIERKILWLKFVEWHKDAYRVEPKFGKPKFFQIFGGKVSEAKKIHGLWYFMGLGVKVEGAARPGSHNGKC